MFTYKNLVLASAAAISLGMTACSTAKPATTQTSSVIWNKSASGVSSEVHNIGLSDRTAAVVFIRPATTDTPNPDSSTNISLNNRFLVSLQDGHYSSGVVCAGDVTLGVTPTAAKTNDLKLAATNIKLDAGKTAYFAVMTDESFKPIVRQVNEELVAQLLKTGVYKQVHQISRVEAKDCAVPVAPTPAPVTPVAQVPTPKTGYYVEKRPNVRLNILFDFDKSNIKPQHQSEIAKAAEFLKEYPTAQVIVEGHTDSKGSDSYNQALSERRAASVRTALITNHGIVPNRISAQGYGETRPVADNSTEEGRTQNRRVMVVIPN
ncbi:OmpA family protein [Moraxella nasovis]|uniref:OmpA family protein n=1 Tax=Moraxella nasovis TaxID=2904121 RepID=UPI001F601B5E|nr:OmpA family protein [Moraxella nasovis]UNU73253.1 OmpA family protein [Moraxella nasovis]